MKSIPLEESPKTLIADVKEDLVLLLRGFFATPVIMSLSRLGAFEVMATLPTFTVDDFPQIRNKEVLQHAFHYLARLGLLLEGGDQAYQSSELGKQVFLRASSFYVPHSYHEYMEKFYGWLTGKIHGPLVDRTENVIGSGKTHRRYFPIAVSFLKRRIQFDTIVDIGSGDGQFLSAVLKSIPDKTAVGIDSSRVSLRKTSETLRKEHPGREIRVICSDAFNIQRWNRQLEAMVKGKNLVFSMWFLLHEISKNDPARVIDFLKRFHSFFPKSPLIFCELVRHANDILARHSRESVMPEYLFFHDLSNQGVLSWQEYGQILENTPYELSFERLFDEIPDEAGNPIPSSFLWCLLPRKNI